MNRITVLCQDKTDPVRDVSELLAANDVNIIDVDYKLLSGEGYLSLKVTDYDLCLSLLTTEGFQVVPDEVVLIRGENRTGELAEISRILADKDIEIRSISLMYVSAEGEVLAIDTDDNEQVREIFSQRLMN